MRPKNPSGEGFQSARHFPSTWPLHHPYGDEGQGVVVKKTRRRLQKFPWNVQNIQPSV